MTIKKMDIHDVDQFVKIVSLVSAKTGKDFTAYYPAQKKIKYPRAYYDLGEFMSICVAPNEYGEYGLYYYDVELPSGLAEYKRYIKSLGKLEALLGAALLAEIKTYNYHADENGVE